MARTVKDFAFIKPINRVELGVWIKEFLGFEIADTVRCTHSDPDSGKPHQSQMDYVAGGFFDEYSSCVLMASRYAGKSYCAAIKVLLKAWFFPKIKIAIAAFKRAQSDFIYNYVEQFLGAFASALGVKIEKIATVTKDYIEFKNGSLIEFFSGGASKSGVKGWHGEILIVDEGDLFTQDQFDGIANSLKSSGDYERQFDCLSTNYSMSGEGVILRQIERLTASASTPGIRPAKVFRICLLDILEKCDDRYVCQVKDPVTGEVMQECPLWKYCRGVAKTGSGGYYKINAAYETLRDQSSQKFESEMLLMRPCSELTYFKNFSHANNVLTDEVELDRTQQIYLMIDFGGGRCPHAAVLAQKNMTTRVYTIVDEWTQMGLLEGMIVRIKARYPDITAICQCYCDNTMDKGLFTTKDSKTPARLLRQMGFHPRSRPFKRAPTFALLDALIDPAGGEPKFLVNKRCKHVIAQIEAAEHKVDQKGKPTSDPSDKIKPDDHLDCVRYMLGWTSGQTALKHGGSGTIRWHKI